MWPAFDLLAPALGLSSRASPIAAVAGACILWGLAFVFAKVALAEVRPAHLVLYRFGIASAILGGVVAHRRSRPRRVDMPLIAVTGFLCVPATMLLQYEGLARTTVTSASLIVGAAPPLLALAAYLAHRERLGRAGWSAIALSSFGIAVMVGLPGTGHDWTGDAMVLGSMLLTASWILLSKRFSSRYDAVSATAYILISGTVALTPIVWLSSGPPPIVLATTTWASLIVLATLCTVLTFILWNWGVERMDAGRAGVFINLEPVVGATAGVALLGDALTAGTVAGGAMVLAAAGIITRAA